MHRIHIPNSHLALSPEWDTEIRRDSALYDWIQNHPGQWPLALGFVPESITGPLIIRNLGWFLYVPSDELAVEIKLLL